MWQAIEAAKALRLKTQPIPRKGDKPSAGTDQELSSNQFAAASIRTELGQSAKEPKPNFHHSQGLRHYPVAHPRRLRLVQMLAQSPGWNKTAEVLALLGTKNEGANPGAVPNPTEPVSGTRTDVSAPSDKV